MKEKINLVFLAPGNSIHSYRWINYFSKKYKITWIYTGTLNYKIKNVNYVNFSYNLILPILPLFFLFKIIQLKPNIIHIHSISKNLFIAILVALLFKKKVILNPWGSDFFYPNYLVSFLQKFIKNNLIFTDSFEIKNILKKNNKVFKINFGVDLNYFNSRKKKIFTNSSKIIFCPRGYDKIYNQFLIIKFLKKNFSKLKKFTFIFSGNINFSEYNKLKKYVYKNKLNQNVKLLGNLNKKTYKQYLLRSDLVISASKSDAGLSSTIAEGMSAKCLVLCTNNRDNPYWISDGISGFLFKNNNLKSFESKFFKIFNLSNKKLNKVRSSAREVQIGNNDLNKEMQKVTTIYNKISSYHY
jgi:glycosyltransferase involved in cell wall biosynthesis